MRRRIAVQGLRLFPGIAAFSYGCGALWQRLYGAAPPFSVSLGLLVCRRPWDLWCLVYVGSILPVVVSVCRQRRPAGFKADCARWPFHWGGGRISQLSWRRGPPLRNAVCVRCLARHFRLGSGLRTGLLRSAWLSLVLTAAPRPEAVRRGVEHRSQCEFPYTMAV